MVATMAAKYMRMITEDHICDPGSVHSAVGTAGPVGASRAQLIDALDPKVKTPGVPKKLELFQMLDDDDKLYYRGIFVTFGAPGHEVSGFEPLDDFGRQNAGCTTIQYITTAGTWETL